MKKFLFIPALLSVLALAACNLPTEIQNTTRVEQQQTEDNQHKMADSVPLPHLETSLERKNLVKRLEHNNKEGLTGYIYLINFGKIMGYYTVAGKVSSLNSYLTGSEKFVKSPSGGCASCNEWNLVESPDLDGAYGFNDTGIFFFTTEGVYVEWKGDYLWTDQPLKLAQPPEFIQNI